MIVIYGASGHTGILIAKALSAQGLDFALAGRDHARLAECAKSVACSDVRVAPVHNLAAMRGIFADADVVINCAGPFSTIGAAVVQAALEADCHYLDTSSEQLFVREVYERFESAARQKKRVVINACAFEIALGDWAAHLAAAAIGDIVLDSVHVSYAVDRLQPSRGTQLSILDAMGKPGCRWDHDRWVRTAPGSQHIDVDFPDPFGRRSALSFPSPEVITIPRHVQSKRVQCFMSLGEDNPLTRAASIVAPIVAPVMTPILGAIFRTTFGSFAQSTIAAQSDDAVEGETQLSRFAIVAEARLDDKLARCAVSGEGIYRVSAGIATLAAERLQNEGELAGVLAPSELLDPTDALEEIAEQFNLTLELP